MRGGCKQIFLLINAPIIVDPNPCPHKLSGCYHEMGEDLCIVHSLAISPHSHGRVLRIHFTSKLSSN
jgi:hypothetical protein